MGRARPTVVAIGALLLLAAVAATSCGGSDDAPPTDPCAGVELPACSALCEDDPLSRCGEPCEVEGETCGNEIGDARTCVDGVYACVVHPPLSPTECNLVCDPDPEP